MKIVCFIANNRVKYGILGGGSIRVITGKPFRSIKPADHFYQLTKLC
ncbi:DUF2437 domain-containing protein [Chloroflexota bacterium]